MVFPLYIGFTTTHEVTLSNTAEIPMTFHFRVANSNWSTSDAGTTSPLPASSDKEFVIVPLSGTLPPSFQQVVRVRKNC